MSAHLVGEGMLDYNYGVKNRKSYDVETPCMDPLKGLDCPFDMVSSFQRQKKLKKLFIANLKTIVKHQLLLLNGSKFGAVAE